jgi:hypothetical protein
MNVPILDGGTELIICQRMINDFEEYLKSDVLYWHVAEPNPLGSHMPQLTIGAFLEALVRAEAGGAEVQLLAEVRAQHDRIRAAHAALYVTKAIHELHSRLDAWQADLLDETSHKSVVLYAQDVRVRAKIYLLEQALGADVPPEIQQVRENLDEQLYEVFVPGAFVWDARLRKFFPEDPCWWLYGHVLEGRS